MQPRCRRDAAEMPPRCRRDTAEMQRLDPLPPCPGRVSGISIGTISRVEKLAQHSHAAGRYGWEGEEVWVADGLRGIFRVHFAP